MQACIKFTCFKISTKRASQWHLGIAYLSVCLKKRQKSATLESCSSSTLFENHTHHTLKNESSANYKNMTQFLEKYMLCLHKYRCNRNKQINFSFWKNIALINIAKNIHGFIYINSEF